MASSHEAQPPCPDPSAHSESADHDSANRAAQLATKPNRNSTSSREVEALGPDGKLSAAGAATSLRYASAKDLPSFPSVGIDTVHSGNRAAKLASSNQKPIELWKPDASSSASKAALLAARDGGKLDLWEYKADGTGNSAATIAMGKKNMSPQLDYGYTDDGRKRALMAATKSLSAKDRAPPPPEPTDSYPDQSNATANALNAATVAGRPSSRIAGSDAARVQNTQGVSREMYTERPPVAIEVEEKRHKEALRASAISMANQLYNLERADVERSTTNPGSVAAERVAAQSYSAATTNLQGDALRVQAMNYIKVQEAAQKLAAERLAKLDPDGVVAYREHYGYNRDYTQAPQKAKMSRQSRYSKKEGNRDLDSDDDEYKAGRIKSQMSHLNDQVAGVDASKRTQDREALMAAAERIVHARMHTMDEKVFQETGKMAPAMAEEWEAKARAKAAADSEVRMENHGKVHIGGGKYMDQADIEAIAAARMQPTLDEITEEAEKRRAHEEAVRLDLELHKQRAEAEKQREREVKAELKREQDEEKEKQRKIKAAEKEKARQEKDAEKEKLKQEKTQRDLEKRNAKDEQKQLKEQQKADKTRAAEQEKAEAERVRLAKIEEAEKQVAEKEAAQKTEEGEAAQKTDEGEAAPEAEALEEEAPKTEEEVPKTAEEAPKEAEEASKEAEETAAPTTTTEEVEPKETTTTEDGGLLEFLHEKKHLDASNPVAPGTVATAEAVPVDATAHEESTAVVEPSTDVPATEVKDETVVSAPGASTTATPAAPEATTADKSVPVVAKPASPTTDKTPGRRDSRVKSFLGRFKRSSKAEGEMKAQPAATTEAKATPASASEPTAATTAAEAAVVAPATTETTEEKAVATSASEPTATETGTEAVVIAPATTETTEAEVVDTSGPEPTAATTSSEAAVVAPAAAEPAPAEPESSENVQDKEPASVSSISNIDDEAEEERGRVGRTDTSNDVFEEARDQFETAPEPPSADFAKESKSESPARTSSKFQEEL